MWRVRACQLPLGPACLRPPTPQRRWRLAPTSNLQHAERMKMASGSTLTMTSSAPCTCARGKGVGACRCQRGVRARRHQTRRATGEKVRCGAVRCVVAPPPAPAPAPPVSAGRAASRVHAWRLARPRARPKPKGGMGGLSDCCPPASTHSRTAAEECGRASVAACRAAPPPQLRPSPDPPWTTTASRAHLHPHGCRAGGRACVLRARGRVPRANEWARLSSSGPGEASAVGTRGGVISLYLFFLSVFVSTHTGVGLVVPTKHLLANRIPNLPTAQRSAAPGQHQQFSTAQVRRFRGAV